MKLIMENWRKFILTEATVKFSGILKLTPDQSIVAELNKRVESLPPEAIPLEEKNWHVTLIHQSFLKPYRKQLKQMSKQGELPAPPLPTLSKEIVVKSNEELQRKSWAIPLENQDEMREYVNGFMTMLGASPNPEPKRVFHISLANLTGNPGGSVK